MVLRELFVKSLFLVSLLTHGAYAALVSMERGESPQERLERLIKEAESDYLASYHLGFAYRNGEGVEKNSNEAIKWFSRAGTQGYPMGYYRIALMYEDGYGLPQDKIEAAKWHRIAALDGFAWSQYELAMMYSDGNVFEKNNEVAAKWLLKSANQGYAPAQTEIGYKYYHGLGVLENFTEAANWWLKAANQERPKAQAAISFLYRHGQGVESNLIKSYAWGLLAVENGYPPQDWNTLRPLMTAPQLTEAQLLSYSIRESQKWEYEKFQVDGLIITKKTWKNSTLDCDLGGIYEFDLQGKINSDSTFILKDIFRSVHPCERKISKELVPIKVSLNSNGGLLSEGYKLGVFFRERNITTVVESGNVCGSSCAVAFIGGKKRILQDNSALILHAPYTFLEDEITKKTYKCIDTKQELEEYKNYFISMTDTENGKRLFERALKYCNPNDGWAIVGKDTAELYGL